MDRCFHDLVIVGAGPAGLTAGLYAARSKRDTILLEKLGAGGQVLTTEWIENYPGFPEGIGGFEIIDRMKKQAERFGLLMENGEVLSLHTEGPQIVLSTPAKRLSCRSVILASGAQARKLGVEGEGSLTGKGVSYCATCDGPFFPDAVVTVVGGGDTAIEEAIYLTKFAARVFVVHRRDQLRCTKILRERARENGKIEFIWNAVVRRIEGADRVQSLQLQDVKTRRESKLDTEAVFIFIGTLPVTGFLKGVVDLDKEGFILVDREMRTNLPGVFAAGDVTSQSVRQVAAAVGQGAIAAINAEKYLEEQGYV
jgi:thioredoxin reductase (NADPH)